MALEDISAKELSKCYIPDFKDTKGVSTLGKTFLGRCIIWLRNTVSGNWNRHKLDIQAGRPIENDLILERFQVMCISKAADLTPLAQRLIKYHTFDNLKTNTTMELTADVVIDHFAIAKDIALATCSNEESQNILAKTGFIKHAETWKGRVQPTTITPEFVQQAGLGPTFKLKDIPGLPEECYLSKAFQAYQISDSSPPAFQMAAIAYVKDGGSYKPRLIYLSGVDNLWRVSPIKDGTRHGKGLELSPENPVKASTNVLFDVGVALFRMFQQGDDSTLVKRTDKNSKQLETIFNMIPDNTLNHMAGHKCTLKSKNAPDDFSVIHHLEPLQLIDSMTPESQPDFSTVKKFSIPGTFSGPVTVYRVASQDKQYEYVFYEAKSHGEKNQWKDDKPHVWLSSVSKQPQESSSYLTCKTSINPLGADISGSEMFGYVNNLNLSDQQKKTISDSTKTKYELIGDQAFVPTWGVRKEFEILKSFEKWKKSS